VLFFNDDMFYSIHPQNGCDGIFSIYSQLRSISTGQFLHPLTRRGAMLFRFVIVVNIWAPSMRTIFCILIFLLHLHELWS
jgi:hypothetical protein